jgi:hypothetical protein
MLWLINNKGLKEGNLTLDEANKKTLEDAKRTADDLRAQEPDGPQAPTTAEQLQLLNDVQSGVTSALVKNGMPTDAMDLSALNNIMDQLQDITDKENEAIAVKAAQVTQHNADLTTATDTTASLCQGSTYFQGSKFGDGFCKLNSGNTVELNQKCNQLTAESCNQTDCCIYINGKKCVAGDANGPTFTTDSNGKDIDYAYYSYKNLCYGSCGKGIANAANPCSAYADTEPGLSIQCIRRLWAETKCPNTRYITADVVDSLKDYSKASILLQMKNAKAEPNYANCYGSNPADWPPPCDGTVDSSASLSSRCLTKLFEDAGCTNTDYTNTTMAADNALEPKSAMVNKFKLIQAGQDDDSLTKCYGPDPKNWPDPCMRADGTQIPDSAKMFTDEVPLRCAKNTWKETLGCPSSEFVDYMKTNPSYAAGFGKTFGEYYKWLKSPANKALIKTKYKSDCYGINPNGWPGVAAAQPDPCAGMTWDTPLSALSNECKARIAGALPNDKNNMNYFTNIKNKLTSNSGGSIGNVWADAALFVDTVNWDNDNLLYSLAVGTDGQVYVREAAHTDWDWYPVPNSKAVRTVVQLMDNSLLAVGMDYNLYTRPHIYSNGWTRANTTPALQFTGVIQLNDGSLMGVGTDSQVYVSASLGNPWTQVTSGCCIVSITQCEDNSFIAVGTDYHLYSRSYPFESSVWTYLPSWQMMAVSNAGGGYIFGIGGGYKLWVLARGSLATPNAPWYLWPKTMDVLYVSYITF